MFRPLAASMCGLLAFPAIAEEGGTLTVDIDGTPHSYSLWAGQSDWSGSESYASVNIYSQPDEDGPFSTFTLGFEVVGGIGQSPEATLRQQLDGETRRLHARDEEEEGGLVLTVESASVSGDELSVSGTFTTEMGPSDNYGRDIDLSDPLAVSGSFDVVLGPVE